MPSSLALVSAALDDLDREINGQTAQFAAPSPGAGVAGATEQAGSCLRLLRAVESRWGCRAEVAGGRVSLRWRAGADFSVSDPDRLAQALDNLVDNAITHGGGEVTINVSRSARGVRLAVCDRGAGLDGDTESGSPASVLARLTGRRRHGHGLTVVREVATAQGGRFFLRPSPWGTRAVLEVPLREPPASSSG